MDERTAMVCIGVVVAVVGLGAVAGLFSLNFGTHKRVEHLPEVWLSANRRLGTSLIVFGAVVATAAAFSSPDLGDAFGWLVLGALLLVFLGLRASLKLLGESRESRRT